MSLELSSSNPILTLHWKAASCCHWYGNPISFSSVYANLVTVQPGAFQQWIKDHTEEFKKRASTGDVDMIGLMKEIEARVEFRQAAG
jgi:hypothetical protein